MKIFLIHLIIFTSSVYGQKNSAIQIPEIITRSFSSLYPSASDIKWETKKETTKVGFKLEKNRHHVWFSNEGKIIKHRYEINKDALPQAVLQAIKNDFSSYKIGDCEKTEENKTESYKVELKSEAGKKNVHFNSLGKIVLKKED